MSRALPMTALISVIFPHAPHAPHTPARARATFAKPFLVPSAPR